jgi:hypothetical protein
MAKKSSSGKKPSTKRDLKPKAAKTGMVRGGRSMAISIPRSGGGGTLKF